MPDNNNGIPFLRRFRTNSLSQEDNESKKHLKMSKAKTKWLERMTLEVNKFPYSNTKNIGLYSFDRGELEWYYMGIRLLVDKVLDILECPCCEDTVKMAVMPGCGCDNPIVCCSKCWLECGSKCPHCHRHCSSLPFEPVDEIVKECHLFLKEKAFNNAMKYKESELKRICESYFQFLKQSEMMLMCNYCFGTLENTMTVNRGNGTRTPLCTGCHELYIECYKNCTDVSPYPTFDQLNREFGLFFSKVLNYCKQNKTQVYSDPYVGIKQPSHFKIRAIQKCGVKGKVMGICKKAIVIVTLAYLLTYLV